MTPRVLIARIRAMGIRRLVAQDAEAEYEYDMADHFYCEACRQQFALASDEAAVQEAAKARHIASEGHKRGGAAWVR